MIRESEFEVEEKHVTSQLIASVRIKGKYSDCGRRLRADRPQFRPADLRQVFFVALRRRISGTRRRLRSLHADSQRQRHRGRRRAPVARRRMRLALAPRPLRTARPFLRQAVRIRQPQEISDRKSNARDLSQRAGHDLQRQPEELPDRDSVLLRGAVARGAADRQRRRPTRTPQFP